MQKPLMLTFAASVAILASIEPAVARSCSDLRALCWTMRSDKSDCTGPYQRCLKTGVFITPLGRVFKATSR
jgi:hypothetical protein